jgi:hypothetical protein
MAVFLPPIKAVLKGDNAAYFLRYAQNQLTILERQMSFQGLNEGRRVISPQDGVTVECLSKFGNKEIRIRVQNNTTTPSKKYTNLPAKPIKKTYRKTKKEIQCVLVAFTSCENSTIVQPFNRVTAWGLSPDYESSNKVEIQNDNILCPAISTFILDVDVLSNVVFFPVCMNGSTEWDDALSKAALYMNSFEDTENHVQLVSGEMVHPDDQAYACEDPVTTFSDVNYAEVSPLGYSYYDHGGYWSTLDGEHSIPAYHLSNCDDKLFLYNTIEWVNLDYAAVAIGSFHMYLTANQSLIDFCDDGIHLGPLSTDPWYQRTGSEIADGNIFINGSYYLAPEYESLSVMFMSSILIDPKYCDVLIRFGWPAGFYELGVLVMSSDAGSIFDIKKPTTHAPAISTPFGIIHPEDYFKYIGEGTFEQVLKPSYEINVAVDIAYEAIPNSVAGITIGTGHWHDQDYCSMVSEPGFMSSASVLRLGMLIETIQELEIGAKKVVLQENPVVALSSCSSASFFRSRYYYYGPGDTDTTNTDGFVYGVTVQVVFPTWLWTGENNDSWKPYDSYLLGQLFRLTEVEDTINDLLAPIATNIFNNTLPADRLSLAGYNVRFRTKLFI